MRKVAAVTTSRADYSHLHWVLHDLRRHPEIQLELIATAAHLSPDFGGAAAEIAQDGHRIDESVECLLSSDTDIGMAKTIGVAVLGLAEVLGRLRPDLLLLIADRYEVLAPAAVATALRIPIAHVEGGEVSEGAIDDAVRNAVTKLSHLHFTPTEKARRRVLSMGEEPWRVHRSGAPSIDHLKRSSLLERAALEAALGTEVPAGTVLVSYHPVTLARDTLRETGELLAAIAALDAPTFFCFPNADAGSRRLIHDAGELSSRLTFARTFVNLNPVVYWSLLRCVALMIGNSSSAIMESPSLGLPAVNVGLRQRGRERAANILDTDPDREAILSAVGRALDPGFRRLLANLENPYGEGEAAGLIVRVLAETPLGEPLLRKRPVERQ